MLSVYDLHLHCGSQKPLQPECRTPQTPLVINYSTVALCQLEILLFLVQNQVDWTFIVLYMITHYTASLVRKESYHVNTDFDLIHIHNTMQSPFIELNYRAMALINTNSIHCRTSFSLHRCQSGLRVALVVIILRIQSPCIKYKCVFPPRYYCTKLN